MKNYRALLFSLLITLSAFSVVTYTACKKEDPCETINCLNGGTCLNGICKCPSSHTGPLCEVDKCAKVKCHNGGSCVNGLCQCPAGFEGDSCQVSIANKFSAQWKGATQCTPQPYDINSIYIEGKTPTTLWAVISGHQGVIQGNITSSTIARFSKTVLTSGTTLDSAILTYIPEGDQLKIDYHITFGSPGNSYQVACTGMYTVQ